MLADPNVQPRPFLPEQELAFAVIMQAIEDLESSDEQLRWEAHEFFLQPKGPSAEMRAFFFEAVGLDHEAVYQALTGKLEPPERPMRKWTFDEIGDYMPRDRAFRAGDICDLTGLRHDQVHSRLQHLKRLGRVVQLDRGVYCHPDYEATWRAENVRLIEAPTHTAFSGFDDKNERLGPTQRAILAAMQDGRETIREIGWDVHLDFNALKCALDRLVDRGIVVKDGPKYHIVQDAAA